MNTRIVTPVMNIVFDAGFAWALHYAVTANAESGKLAVDWAMQPGSTDLRQLAMVYDWCPKMMTVVAAFVGLLPIMWATGAGADVMQRIAAPMVGGMISAPLLSMFIVPAAYLLMRRPRTPPQTTVHHALPA